MIRADTHPHTDNKKRPVPTRSTPVKPSKAALGALFACALFVGALPSCDGDPPETLSPRIGTVVESFVEPARTRIEDIHTIRMPIDGRAGPITLRAGDPVKSGQELGTLDQVPLRAAVNEATSRISELEANLALKRDDRLENTIGEESSAMVEAMEEILRSADQAIDARQARDEHLQRERNRIEALAEEGTVSERQLDDARVAADASLIELRQQEFQRQALTALSTAVQLGPRFVSEYIERKGLERAVIEHQLAQAQSRLAVAKHELSIANIQSPADGVVLTRYHRGSAPLSAGEPLLLIGDPKDLEIEVDVLTQDALRLSSGSPVEIEVAHRSEPLLGQVVRIDPMGFTKLSSLGVEQQRIRVIVRPTEVDSTLGVQYRVRVRFMCKTATDALLLPRHALLSDADGNRFVLLSAGGSLERRDITTGLESDAEVQVLSGLTANDRVVSYPDTELAEDAQ